MRALQERRETVLRVIIEDYIARAVPVASSAIVERYGLKVSTATIRNDMAQLEEEGLIAAPHTSAGRIPTDSGYRLFVDRITEVRPLSRAERRAMEAERETIDAAMSMIEGSARSMGIQVTE